MDARQRSILGWILMGGMFASFVGTLFYTESPSAAIAVLGALIAIACTLTLTASAIVSELKQSPKKG